MCIREDGTAPEFYDNYVKEVQSVIKRNAYLEFEAIWREHAETGEARSILSDKLSVAITKMDEELQGSDLWDDVAFRRSVLGDALPNLLLQKIGLDTLLERVSPSIITCQYTLDPYSYLIQVPDNYLRAIFGSYLASRFVYEYGINASQFAFFSL
jgi:glutamate dehydrogenase